MEKWDDNIQNKSAYLWPPLGVLTRMSIFLSATEASIFWSSGEDVRVMNTAQCICSWQRMSLHCSALRCHPKSPDACGCPESACGQISSPADPSASILLSTHLDLWCNCIIWEEFLYKSLKNKENQNPSMMKGGLSSLPHVAGFDQALHVGLFVAVVGHAMVLVTFWNCIFWCQCTMGAWWSHVRGNALHLSLSKGKDTLGNGSKSAFFWEGHSMPGVTPPPPADLKSNSVSTIGHRKELSFPLMECGKKRGRMRKCSRAKEQSLSLLIQQAWDSVKSNMSDKALTMCGCARLRSNRWIFLKIMNALTCLQRPDCLVSRFCALWVSVNIWSEAWDSCPQRFSGSFV